MRARDLPDLSQPKTALSEKAKQRLIDRAHVQALKMNAEWDALHKQSKQRPKKESAALRACQKKRAFSSPDAAATAAAASSDGGRVLLSAYQCSVCGQWHLTSKGLWLNKRRSRQTPHA